jgi:hypothetical protein
MRNDHPQKQAHAKAPTSKPASPPSPTSKGEPNEGEGNRTAARRYDTATVDYIASGRSEAAAKAAAAALDGPEADELRAAESVGKAGHPRQSPSTKR